MEDFTRLFTTLLTCSEGEDARTWISVSGLDSELFSPISTINGLSICVGWAIPWITAANPLDSCDCETF